ncbi:MAG: HD-GYP domain-containing protein [Thermoleophilia bacterium]
MTVAAATIRASDGGTGAHSDDVVHLCDAIADELGVYGDNRAELLAAAQLHDIGKVAIPHDVLNKAGPLDDREWALIREHTVVGEQIVRSVPELAEVARLVRHSHERWDGGGYPDKLSGEAIPLGSRIVFCADAFHAIRSDRPYRQGRTAQATLHEVKRHAGTQFDPAVVDALVRHAARIGDLTRAGGKGFAATLRSRRLAVLLLTLAVSGSALAATGSDIFGGAGDAEPTKPAPALKSPTLVPAWPLLKNLNGGRSAPKRASGGTAERLQPSTARGAAATNAGRAAARGGTSAHGARSQPRTPAAAGRPAPTAVPARRRPRRSTSPGRSGEAPRRPARPGGGAGRAGRSAEAPGRPSQPVRPGGDGPSGSARTR